MITLISKWGNSLGLRIPKTLAAELNVGEGDAVDVAVENGALIIRPSRTRYTIEELVADMTPEDETDWGPASGKEIW
jgi:antitoxin MazE